MNIGIVSPFNPVCLSEYLDDCNIPDTHTMASSVHCIAQEMIRQGHHVFVFTTDTDIKHDVVIKGRNCTVCVVSRQSKLKRFGVPPILLSVKRLEKAISNFIPELDVLHAHWTYEYALASCHFVRSIPVFCTVRDWCPYHFKHANGAQDKMLWGIKYFLFKKVMSCDKLHVIANSHYTYKEICDSYPFREPVIIPNPINKELIVGSKTQENTSNRFITIAQTLTNPAKNIENLLIAYQMYRKSHPDAVLTLVGNADSAYCQKWKEKGLLECTHFTGNLSHESVIKEIDKSFCLVHPSRQETFGNILLESMARGVPCIGGQQAAAVPCVLDMGRCGILCDIEDSRSICEAMVKIGDYELRNSIIGNASNMVHTTYSSDVVVQRHIDLYKSVLSQS